MEVHKEAALLCAVAIFCRVERVTDQHEETFEVDDDKNML
jgi:hypothetical protein